MESSGNFSNNRHTVLLDISLFVLDMLSPEKIKAKYGQQDDGIVLEVPSAFITMIADAQAGNSLLKQFIDANLIALKNNPIHQQSRDPLIQNLVNATNEKLEEIKNNVQQTILVEFAPLIKDISKTNRLVRQNQNDELPSVVYPIQVYEPLVPVSSDDLHTLRRAYWQELHLLPHPLYDLYFLQIYHAQAVIFSRTSANQRDLLSVGLATYKTIQVWKHGIFGAVLNNNEIKGERGTKEAQVRDDTISFLRYFAVNYFRKKWEAVANNLIEIGVDLAFIFADTGRLGPEDVAIKVVTLYGMKLIEKGVEEKNPREIIFGIIIVSLMCLFTTSGGIKLLGGFLSSPTPTAVIPKIILTISEEPQVVFTVIPTQDLTAVASTSAVNETPVLLTAVPQNTAHLPDPGYCMYVVQSGDTIQSVASRFRVSEDEIRSQNQHVALNIFVENQLVRINTSCCTPINGNGFPYTVQYKDDLYSISRTYSVDEGIIASANNLYNLSYIQTGQMLCIPSP